MSTFPDRQTFQDIARDLRTSPALLMKDWYVSIVIQILSYLKDPGFIPLFGGGTSLMKAFKIIHRFSEDIDFKIIPQGSIPFTRIMRRQYRTHILLSIDCHPDLSINKETIISRNNSKFYSAMFSYPKTFGDHPSIRPEIKIERTFTGTPIIPPIVKTIMPIIGEYIETDIRCISIGETASDKISALLWRTLSRNRHDEKDDKTIIRHLYDLTQISIKTDREKLFIIQDEGEKQYLKDRKRDLNCPENFEYAAKMTLDLFNNDPLYQSEYEKYVLAMCFGKETPPVFQTCIENFKALVFQ